MHGGENRQILLQQQSKRVMAPAQAIERFRQAGAMMSLALFTRSLSSA